MTEYWKSQGKKWCEYCRNWMQNNPAAIRMHEGSTHHKTMVQEFLSDKSRKRKNEEIAKNELDKELKAAMQAADKQYALDIASGHAVGNAPHVKGTVVRDADYEANIAYYQTKNAASLQNFYEQNAAKIEEMKTKYHLEKQKEEEEAQATLKAYMEQRGIKIPEKKNDVEEDKVEEEEEEEEEDAKKTKKQKDNIIIPPPAPAAVQNPEEAPMPGAWSVVEEKSEASSEAEKKKKKQKRVITVVLGEEGIDRVDDTAGILNDKEEEEERGDGNESDELRAEVDAEVKVEEEEEEAPAKPVVFAKRTPFKGNARARSKAPAGGDDD